MKRPSFAQGRAIGVSILLCSSCVGLSGCRWIDGIRGKTSDRGPDRTISPLESSSLEDRRTNSTTGARRGPGGGVMGRSNGAGSGELTTPRPAVQSTDEANLSDRTFGTTVPTLQGDTFVWLGAMIAQVNGTPLFAHDLLRRIEPVLKARSKELAEDKFRVSAMVEIRNRRQAMIRDELFFAAAQRNTSSAEKNQAEQLAMQDGQRIITQAGGSTEVAKRVSREQGYDYDKLKEEMYRNRLVSVYFSKRLQPRARVSVDEMRRYFAQNREKQFTQKAELKFAVIRIDFATAGESDARAKIETARQKLESGEDFAVVSGEFNTDKGLRERQGIVGPLERGSYRVTEVEDAIWSTEVGKTTPAVFAGGSAWVGKVLEKKASVERSFDDSAVQREIEAKLRQAKLAELEDEQNKLLEREAVVDRRDELLQPALQMALQMYSEWRNEE